MSALPAATLPARRLSPTHALWLKASILVSFLAASSAPSPLYAIYREAWGFSALTLTVVFSSYAFALLGALLVFGALSDHRGRREVLLGALGLELVALGVFWSAESVNALLAARVLQGVATGIATSALSAGLLDLHRERGALVNSVAPMIGLGVGALGASVLAQYAASPTQLVFDFLLVVFALQALAALYLPETVARRAGAWRSLVPSIALPPQVRTTMWQVLPVNTAQWALGGFYLSLGPTLARSVTHVDSPMMGGALIATQVLGAAAAILLVSRRPARWALAAGAAGVAIGAGVTVIGMQLGSTPLFFFGTLLAGLGFGAALSGSMRSLVPLAAPQERAGLMSSYFVLSYLAFSIPAIAAGLFAGRYGLQATATGYGLAVMAMAVVALLLMIRRRA